ncbi:MAG: molybdenum cofactor guanylyltransferase MobA [Paracoccaceae bacterium]|nr:molybdenum cofactor guanylyltransferase MobA [Paracoccaceae bacterium]
MVGVILAGGLASRMGGGDKSLKLLGEKTILEYVIDRLSPQVTRVVLNANGDPQRFSKFKIPVIHDQTDRFLGPLAGVLSGLDWANDNGFNQIVTVAADTPFFPMSLVKTLCDSLSNSDSQIALATSNGKDSKKIIRHPTFGLWPVSLRNNLRDSLNLGVRKVVTWTELHDHVDVLFKIDVEDPFFNVNTYEDLDIAKRRINLEAK